MRCYVSLRRTHEFSALRRRGRRIATPALTVFRMAARQEDRRAVVGITVSKAVGNAVVRNTVRRRVSAILRQSLAQRRLRLLVVASPAAARTPYAELAEQLLGTLG
ncbi:MAG: ribonuclease P protein component [Vulcanimicrobiaceae bacterium]